jgi:AmiR/NasT family two-component response regulator
MDRFGMTEADAFSFIQRTAMRMRAKMKVIAEQVIAGRITP